MKRLTGKIRPLPGIKGTIHRRSETYAVKIWPFPSIKGTIHRRSETYAAKIRIRASFSGVVNRLYVLYRFIAAKSAVWVCHVTKHSTAPAATIKVEKSVKVERSMTPIGSPAVLPKAKRTEYLTHNILPLAYRIGNVYAHCAVIMGHVAAVIRAPGATAKYYKVFWQGRMAKAEKATAAIAESRNNQEAFERVAAAILAAARTASIEKGLCTGSTLEVATAGVSPAGVQSWQYTGASVKMGLAFSVMFMRYDGTESYEYIIHDSESCLDPVAEGLIEVPTRPSDAQYHYTAFLGWSLTNGGDVDETALTNITKPTKLYPVFEKELRSYEISFYDGESLIYTVTVPYGETPSYTPQKAGYVFIGWAPEIVPVTGEARYGAMWISDYLAAGTCGESLTWTLSKAGDLVISGTGEMDNYSSVSEQPWYGYAAAINTVTVEEGVTSVGSYAFRECSRISSVTLAETVTSFGGNCFRLCTGLTAFTIPEGITKIPTSCFYGCSGLESIVIPANVTTIGPFAFRECTSLGINQTVTDTTRDYVVRGDAVKFFDWLTTGDNSKLETIDYYAFYGCTNIKGIELPSTLKTINYRAFWKCSKLKKITLPYRLTLIGDNAFLETDLSSAQFYNTRGWVVYNSSTATSGTSISHANLSLNHEMKYYLAAIYLTSTYVAKWWRNNSV